VSADKGAGYGRYGTGAALSGFFDKEEGYLPAAQVKSQDDKARGGNKKGTSP
jgi:hypothetical protein